MNKELYLVFIDNVGTNLDDKLVYQLYFSETPEVVWGEFWNVCPCGIVPNIRPDKATINFIYEIEIDYEISTITENTCFSMQDCIDGVVSLGWIDFQERIRRDGKLIKFDFGEEFSETKSKISYLDGAMNIVWENKDESEDAINDLINKIGGNGDEW